MSKAKEFNNLLEDYMDIFPVKVVSGEIDSVNGKTLLRADRKPGGALYPVEQDALIHFVAYLLNMNKSKFEDFVKKYKG